MTKRGEAIAARARALIGVRFRPQGRSQDLGLDCIGLVALALQIEPEQKAYSLHGGCLSDLERSLSDSGLRKVRMARPGDVLLLKISPAQWHLAIVTDAGFVHAHAGLRRVTETPGWPEWPVAGIWRQRVRGQKVAKWQR